MGQHCRTRPCWTTPPPPDEGAGARTDTPKGIAPRCSCSLPSLTQTPLTPSHHPGMPLVMAVVAVPHPRAPCITCMLGPYACHTRFAWGAIAAPLSYPSAGGGGGRFPMTLRPPQGESLGLGPPLQRGPPPLPLLRYPSRVGGPPTQPTPPPPRMGDLCPSAQQEPLPLPPHRLLRGTGGGAPAMLVDPPPPLSPVAPISRRETFPKTLSSP